jgi:hypothetical protein
MKYNSTFDEILDTCSLLDPYGVIIKYPNQLELDESLAKIIIDRAQKIYDFCKTKIT